MSHMAKRQARDCPDKKRPVRVIATPQIVRADKAQPRTVPFFQKDAPFLSSTSLKGKRFQIKE